MRKILMFCLAAATQTGCSQAFIDKMSTEKYSGHEPAPFINEHPIGVQDHFGVLKRLIVHNPLGQDVDVNIVCSSMFMNDPVIRVKANTSKFIVISASKANEYSQSCWIRDMRFSDAQVNH